MKYHIPKLLTVLCIVFILQVFVSTPDAAPGPGDGNLLKRAPGETCEGCHKTNRNTPSPGEAGYDQATWNNAIKMHSGELAGTCSNATYKTKTACESNAGTWSFGKWDASGGWGVVGGLYGEFECTTCHTGHFTVNIFLIKELITAPSGSFPGGAVDFRTIADGIPANPGPQTPGIMGDDTTTHSTSSFICEVCHTYSLGNLGVKYHAYNMSTTTPHNNAKNCTTSACHSHKLGFRIDVAAACGDCHGAPPSSNSLTRGSGGLVTSDPVVPYGVTGRDTLFSPNGQGAHVAHRDKVVGTDCSYCHYGGMSSYTQGSGQADSDYDHNLAIGFYGWGSAQNGTYNAPAFSNLYTLVAGPGSGTTVGSGASRTCSSIYCHSNVQSLTDGTGSPPLYATGDWDDPTSGQCGTCHLADGVQGNASLMASGDHTRHVEGSGVNYSFSCSTCHDGAGSPELIHVNKVINVNFAAAYGGAYSGGTTPGDHSPGGGYGSCSTTYCHSQGQSTTGDFGGAPNTTAVWAGTVPTCEGCHNYDAVATNKMNSGKHTPHMNDGTIMPNIACSACHTDTTSDSTTITNKANHVNQVKDVTIAGFYDSNGTPGDNWSGTQCDNVYCHSSGEAPPAYKTILWSATISDCKSCHNYDAASAPNDMQTGQHTQHMNQASVIGTNYGCQECHNTTTSNGTSITTPANHIDKTRTVAILKDSDKSTCTSIYCHSSGQNTPTYDDPAAWTVGESLGCNGCHGTGTSFGEPDYPNGSQPAVVENNDNSHSAHVTAATDCARCHTDTADAAGTAIKAGSTLHTNQTRNINFASTYDDNGGSNSDNYDGPTKTCSAITCHGAGTPMWGGASLACDQCHLANNTLAGSHPKHYGTATVAVDRTASNTSSGTAYIFNCGVCHDSQPHADGNFSANQAAQVAFDATIALGGSYAPGGSLAGTDPIGNFEYTSGTCSSTYCHSQGQSTTGDFGGAPNTTAVWAGTVPTCEGCHNYDANATNKMNSGKHTPHMNDGTIMTNVACSACHTDTTSDSTTITNEANHVNKTKDVTIAGTYDSNGVPGDNWSGTQCNNVYCHSTGESPTPTYKIILWSATISDCKSCHNYDVGSGTPMNTGNHTEHMNQASVIGTNYGCQECHNTTTSNGTSITTPANHIDKTRTVAILKDSDKSTCTSIYCHSTGQATPAYVDPPSWGSVTALGCDSCHGTEGGTAFGEPAYANGSLPTGVENDDNSHSLHVTAATDCTKCHTDTADAAGTAIKASSTLHTNQARNVNFAAAYNGDGGSNSDNYNGGTKTCSAVVCHGPGSSPMWGYNTSNDTCTKCHGTGTAPPVDGTNRYVVAPPKDLVGNSSNGTDTGLVDTTLNSKIGAHQTHLRLLNGLKSSAVETLDTRCEDCHGTIPTDITHANGSASPAFQGLASTNSYGTMNPLPSYNSGAQRCDNTYCHNPAGTGGSLASGNAGTNTAPTWNDAAYLGDPTLKNQTNCDRCHLSPNGARVISGSQDHSGLDVDTHGCASCHGHDGDTQGAAGERHIDGIRFGAGGDSCAGCHGALLASGRHAVHSDASFLTGKLLTNNDYGKIAPDPGAWWYNMTYSSGVPKYACGYCHPQSVATHQNGTKNLNFSPTDGGAAGTIKAKNNATESYSQNPGVSVTCSSVYCHSNGYAPTYGYKTSPNWFVGQANDDFTDTDPDKCSACHGNSPNENGNAGSSAHGMHVVGVHYKDIYSGTSGQIAAAGGVGSGAAHGDKSINGNTESTSTTINCHICHINTVTVNFNDRHQNNTSVNNGACSDCHGSSAPAMGNMDVSATNTSHVNGTPDVVFANVSMNVKAQMRDDITTLDELNENWTRTNGYKAGATSYDAAKKSLNAGTYTSATQTCNNIACHNQDVVGTRSIQWTNTLPTDANLCYNCHRRLPR